VLIFLALTASGCGGKSEPLAMNVFRTTAAMSDNGKAVVVIEVELENRGQEPVHLSYDSVQVVTAEGERSSMRALRHALKAGSVAPDQEELLEALQKLSIDQRQLRDLVQDAIEIAPGTKVIRTFPFSLEKSPQRMTLELTYHDVATDEVLHVRREVRLLG
jgi:hypothetical protein